MLAATLPPTTLMFGTTESGAELLLNLAPCPKCPNCVSSQATDSAHAIEPLKFAGDPGVAWKTLKGIVESMGRTKIVEESDTVLRAEVTSRGPV